MIPSPVHWATVLPYRCTTTAQRSESSAMISRNRSAPTAAAMSIECTTSANSTVTCLNSAWVSCAVTGAPHSLQNFEFAGSSVPHDLHTKAAAVMSTGQPPLFHVVIVSPLAGQHVGYCSRDPAYGCALRSASVWAWACGLDAFPCRTATPLSSTARGPRNCSGALLRSSYLNARDYSHCALYARLSRGSTSAVRGVRDVE
jgi:hypothetical protein